MAKGALAWAGFFSSKGALAWGRILFFDNDVAPVYSMHYVIRAFGFTGFSPFSVNSQCGVVTTGAFALPAIVHQYACARTYMHPCTHTHAPHARTHAHTNVRTDVHFWQVRPDGLTDDDVQQTLCRARTRRHEPVRSRWRDRLRGLRESPYHRTWRQK